MHVSNLPLHKFQKSAGNLPPGIPLGSFFVRNSAAKARAAHPKLPPSSNNAAPAGRSLGPGRFKRQSHRGLRARYSLPEPLPLEPFLSGLSTCFFPLEHFSPAFSALSAHRSSPPPLRPSLSAVVPPTHFVTSRRPPAPLRRTQSPAVFPPTLSTIHPSCLPAPPSAVLPHPFRLLVDPLCRPFHGLPASWPTPCALHRPFAGCVRNQVRHGGLHSQDSLRCAAKQTCADSQKAYPYSQMLFF